MNSGSRTARLAGLLWFLNTATQAFGLAYARPRLIVSGQAAATASNILANEWLFRAALASNLFSAIFLLFFGLTLYHLFREGHRILARVLLASILISVAIALVNLLNSFGALIVVSPAEYLNAFSPEQRGALALVFLRLNNFGLGLVELMWAPYLFTFGLLIIQSRYLPRPLAVLLILMSAAFPLNTLTKLLVPDFYPALFTQAAALLGALASVPTILWLLIKGVNAERWNQRAPAAA